MKCRYCQSETQQILDLGHQPPSNSFLTKEETHQPETYYPLEVFVCPKCWLMQIPDIGPTPFNNRYPYYSSQSPANVSHAKEFAATMMEMFNPKTVLEIGSNDGYLLQWFNKYPEVITLGLEPASGPAEAARKIGVQTDQEPFSAYKDRKSVV